MPDFTDDFLLPFPTDEEYGDGSNGLEELARAVDPAIVAQNTRITTLATRPTVIRTRTVDLAISTSFPTLTWDGVPHNNFSAVNMATPAVGAHPVAGVYPALWRFDLFVIYQATAPVLGAYRETYVAQRQTLPGFTFIQEPRRWVNVQLETNTGGENISISGATVLDRPAEFLALMSFAVAGAVKAGSRFCLTRIRSV